MRALRLVWSVAAPLLAALVLALPAGAAGKLDLGAEVISAHAATTYVCGYPTKIALTDHGRAAGVIKVKSCAATGTGTSYSGSADLAVGSLTGPAHFGVAFHAEPPNFTETRFGDGSVGKGEEHEDLRVKGASLPSEVGARFQLILYTGTGGSG